MGMYHPLPGTESAAARGYGLCQACHRVQPCPPDHPVYCQRCGARITQRIPHSLQKTWFFVIVATLLLVPANLVPIMSVMNWGRAEPDTIISGIIKLAVEGYPGIAVVVFTASVVVPIGKLLTLTFLLLSVQYRWRFSREARGRAFRVLDFIGRWSMLDIFVVAIMVALVHLGQIVAVLPGAGALLFGASVVVTLLAALSFDPRLIWDAAAPQTH